MRIIPKRNDISYDQYKQSFLRIHFGALPMAYHRPRSLVSALAAVLIVGLFVQRSRHGRAKAALRTTSDERYLLALAGSTDGFWDWDLLSDSVFYSDRFREILGYSSRSFQARWILSAADCTLRTPRASGLRSNAIFKSVSHTKSNTA